MENGNIAKRVYVEECDGSHSVGETRTWRIDTSKDCLKKEVWMSNKQGEWGMVEVNGKGL